MANTHSFLLMPGAGLHASEDRADGQVLRRLAHPDLVGTGRATELDLEGARHAIEVVDSSHPAGPKLIRMARDAGRALARRPGIGGLRLFENRLYRTHAVRAATLPRSEDPHTGIDPADLMTIGFTITDSATGKPVEGATVMVYYNQAKHQGTGAKTDAAGRAETRWLKTLPTIEQIWVMPPDPPLWWGAFAKDVAAADSFEIAIDPVDPAWRDVVRFYLPRPSFDISAGVVVAILDTGVAEEPGLTLSGGMNTVEGEPDTDWGSNGDPHGTHVAGLAGADTARIKGAAPGVTLRSYRVFGAGGAPAATFAIVKAVTAAVADGCDILNLSLGIDGTDPPLAEAIAHARDMGALVIAAGDNSYGGAVGSPAANPDCVAVSALGRTDCLPSGAQPQADVTSTRGSDPDCFLPSFSCIGSQLDLIGPGVGAISTVPGGFGQMSGSSMACPVISGLAAQILARRRDIFTAPRTRARSDALCEALEESARSMGLAPDQEGRGMPKVGMAE